MDPRIAQNRRVYLTVAPDSPGRFCLKLSLHPPRVGADPVALISRGTLVDDQDVCLSIVSDPAQVPELRGKPGDPGASAYQIAREAGYGGTLTQWLASLAGAPGQSAYQLARAEGYGGTLTQWLASLKGADGKNAAALLGSVTLAENSLVGISAGVRRRVVTATFDVPAGVPLLLKPKAPPPLGFIVQEAWAVTAAKPRELTVDMTVPAITALTSYAIDCWLLRLTA